MEKQRTSNPKISYTILCMIFSVMFILTALNFPTPAYAEETSLGQTLNLGSFSANETDESSNEQAGYLYGQPQANEVAYIIMHKTTH